MSVGEVQEQEGYPLLVGCDALRGKQKLNES